MQCCEGGVLVQKIKFYSPLMADFFPTEIYENEEWLNLEGPTMFLGDDLAYYEQEIQQEIARMKTNLAERCTDLKEMVISMIPGAEIVDGKLLGCTEVLLKRHLRQDEMEKLTHFLEKQFSEGWGREFEQREIQARDGFLFIHFWNDEDFALERKDVSEKF
jgi:hypothetical protein